MDIEPLDTDLWFAALGRLEQRLSAAGESELGQVFRHAFHLQQLTPRWLRGFVRARLDELEFENILEAGAYELAADALVGPPLSYTIEQHGPSLVQATILLPGTTSPILFRGTNHPAAVLGAWVRCLQTLEDHSMEGVQERAVCYAFPTSADSSLGKSGDQLSARPFCR